MQAPLQILNGLKWREGCFRLDAPLLAVKPNIQRLDHRFQEFVADPTFLLRLKADFCSKQVQKAMHSCKNFLNTHLGQHAAQFFALLLQLGIQVVKVLIIQTLAAHVVVAQQGLVHPVTGNGVDLLVSERSQTLRGTFRMLDGLDDEFFL